MSINNSYFSRNNTIISNSSTNTGRNPVTEIFYGNTVDSLYPNGYSRFIFNLDLDLLKSKIYDGTISTGCTTTITHKLKMTNTTSFTLEYLNTSNSQSRQRATSFDLILFRIPFINNNPNTPQLWDEGVGYDYINQFDEVFGDKNYSLRPSNWYQTTTIDKWQQPGMYSNTESGDTPFSSLIIVDTQHFELGNENISFDMTDEINGILDGSITGVTGWGIAYLPAFETITGLTSNYSVSFFSRFTQTFYEPFLMTTYDDIILDDRNYKNKIVIK